MKYFTILTILFILFTCVVAAQQIDKLTKDQVMELSVEELSDLPFEELMDIMDVMGVSTMDELYNLIMNKDVTSASKKVENAFDSPLSSTVLTRREIDDYGATTFEEALRLVPGVIVREKTNGYFDVHIRGLDNLPPKNMLIFSQNKNTLLMVDGRPVFNYIHGGTLWESLSIGFEDLDRIEVVRGPSSALYGPNAVNGVINLITRDVSSRSGIVSGSASGGTLNTYKGDISIHNSWSNRFSAGITANFQHRDRVTDKIYLFPETDSVFIDNEYTDLSNGGFFDIYDYDKMRKGPLRNYLKDPRDNIDELFEDPGLARENMGINGYLQFDPKGDIQFDLSGGYQTSYLNGSTLGDSPTSFWGRTSTSGYVNLTGNIGKLNVQSNYMTGNRNFDTGNPGFHLKVGQFNAAVDYDLQLKSLNLRPGISFQSVHYNDTPYLLQDEAQNGYLNGRKDLNTASVSLRADYMAFGKLRLIAALRADKYTDPDPIYPSWQFATTYPITKNQTLRMVYSRANSSSFILNTHSDYYWDRSDLMMPPTTLHFAGSTDIDLMTSDMVEIGFRSRLFGNILLDLEVFGAKSRDFISLNADHSWVDLAGEPTPTGLPESFSRISFMDSPLESTQIGGSLNMDWIISEKLIFRGHANLQQTMLDNYFPYSKLKVLNMQLTKLFSTAALLGAGELSPQDDLSPAYLREDGKLETRFTPDELQDDIKHKATPQFWGMVGLIYRPFKQWQLSTNGYYTSNQTFINQNTTVDIEPKLVLSGKASFKPSEKIEVFIHGHNILNNTSTEFAFMDPVGEIYMMGLKFKY